VHQQHASHQFLGVLDLAPHVLDFALQGIEIDQIRLQQLLGMVKVGRDAVGVEVMRVSSASMSDAASMYNFQAKADHEAIQGVFITTNEWFPMLCARTHLDFVVAGEDGRHQRVAVVKVIYGVVSVAESGCS